MELEVRNLTKTMGKKTVLQSLSLELNRGEVVGLLGANGSGKSTAFYLMMGLLKVDKGQIFLRSTDITHMSVHHRSLLGLGYLAQRSSVFRSMSVEDNLLATMEIRRLPTERKQERLQELLELFSITHIRHRKAALLSGGERRRVEVARVLITEPKFLLLDEPFAGVDPVTISEMQDMIRRLQKDGLGILITDHNAREILRCCSRTYVLAEGQVIASGSREDIVNHPQVRESYLGENFAL